MIIIVIFHQLRKIKMFLLCNPNQLAQVEFHVFTTQEKAAYYFLDIG